ncbi:MAG: cation transporter [Clostridia bacterium]|nr:cation transporter [Clostridia bacterium]
MNLSNELSATTDRSKKIVRTSILGIAANVFLAAFKAVVGLGVHSIAIVLDAVNNITDAASSLITIIGTTLAGKAPDRKHPFGHGRAEYLSALLISFLVLYAGIAAMTESIKKIITPVTPDYSTVSLIIVAVAVVVKIFLGRYFHRVGKTVNSQSLQNSGTDALLDAVISVSTLAAAGIFLWKGISLEPYLGAAISLVILKSGIDMLRETISQLLGERANADLAKGIKETVLSFPDVSGVYDLVLNNYGPDAFNGSLHIEVPDTYAANELDELIRAITVKVYQEHNVLLTAVGVFSVNTHDPEIIAMREKISEMVLKNEYVLQIHGFFVNEEKKTIRFDLIISFDAKDRVAVYNDILREVQSVYPDYTFEVVLDTDFCES